MKFDCYTDIADVYHLIFEDWEEQINTQEKILSRLLPFDKKAGPVLDCACGIGTQSIALAAAGYQVEGVDLASAQVDRAKQEAAKRGFEIPFKVDDMRLLKTAPLNHYQAVITLDNSLPHLDSDEEILSAFSAMRDRLKKGGTFLLSIRDYGPLMKQRPHYSDPRFFMDGGYRRFFHQVWDWQDERRYKVHFYITYETKEGWQNHHSVGQYRAISSEEVVALAQKTGFKNLQILPPAATGFYQPIISGIV